MSNWSNIDGAALDRWLTTPPEDESGDESEGEPPQRIITPEQQIANVRAALDTLRASRRHRHRIDAIRRTEAQLARMEAAHARGELAALVDDGVAF